ncbi:MAG: hypothetical protein MZU95_03005 [Desulfomicrobium escambiense]|nr:hypothetical protein [Desulfomicrobium escambiense]
MPYAEIRNKSRVFVKPTIASVSLAADVVMPADTRVSITDTDAKEGYPISGFTWLVLYKRAAVRRQNKSARGKSCKAPVVDYS